MDVQDFIGIVRKARYKKEAKDKYDLDSSNLYTVTYYKLEKKLVKFITGSSRQDAIDRFKTMNRDVEIIGVIKSNAPGKIKIK